VLMGREDGAQKTGLQDQVKAPCASCVSAWCSVRFGQQGLANILWFSRLVKTHTRIRYLLHYLQESQLL
jgi:hypothetical protein